MTVVSATLLIPSVLIFHFLLAALYLAQSSHHLSCSYSCLLLCAVPPFLFLSPLLACYGVWVGKGASIRSSSLSLAVTYNPPHPHWCRTIRLAHVIVSTGVVAFCPR